MNCLLCEGKTELFKMWREKEYYRCTKCKSIMLEPKYYINYIEEKERYEKHNNDVEDKGYQEFVWPIVEGVLNKYEKHHKGLDYGSGPGPVISKLLREKGYNIKLYDPFFANYPERLEDKYDYIVSCEVVEHFHKPMEEFKLLKSLLKPGGTLYIKTKIYSEDIDFDGWSYKNDNTHVFFYHKDALEWIKTNFRFSQVKIEKDLITYVL